ncbi:hypothetical protein DVH24_005196 [Malus domestica]|uniref:Ubiquitinyl hydrolase 1 n=1 Tax=Malus domestica TaxID=3750 RepID=A0A498IGM6_MALDO|nr:hypothetical protein DVH24_005196 [Malus domestica]
MIVEGSRFLIQFEMVPRSWLHKSLAYQCNFSGFGIWAKRHNHTYCPIRPLIPEEQLQSVITLHFLLFKINVLFLRLRKPKKISCFCLSFMNRRNKNYVSLRASRDFSKIKSTGWFFPRKKLNFMRSISHLFFLANSRVITIRCTFRLPEIKFDPRDRCDHLGKRTSFRLSEMGTLSAFKNPLHLKAKKNDMEAFTCFSHLLLLVSGGLSLRSKLHTYNDVVEKVARKIGLEDPTKIRLISPTDQLTERKAFNRYARPLQSSRWHYIEMPLSFNLLLMLIGSDIIYYEVLDIPWPELEIHCIRLPKQNTVGDVISILKRKVQLSHPDADIRLLEVYHHKIHRIPEEAKILRLHQRLIQVYHFTKETAQNKMSICRILILFLADFREEMFMVHESNTMGWSTLQ